MRCGRVPPVVESTLASQTMSAVLHRPASSTRTPANPSGGACAADPVGGADPKINGSGRATASGVAQRSRMAGPSMVTGWGQATGSR